MMACTDAQDKVWHELQKWRADGVSFRYDRATDRIGYEAPLLLGPLVKTWIGRCPIVLREILLMEAELDQSRLAFGKWLYQHDRLTRTPKQQRRLADTLLATAVDRDWTP